MFTEGARFVQNINEVIRMLLEEASNGVLRSAENRPKRKNYGKGIDLLVILFDGKTHKSLMHYFMR